MRHSSGLGYGFAALLASACTIPPPVPQSVTLAPEQPAIVFAAVPPPPAAAETLAPLGPNPGCPSLQVFTDPEDLCARGILPTHPFGRCQGSDVLRVAAMGGSAEFFFKDYIGYGDSELEAEYLALRGANGYVLLTMVSHYNSRANDPPQTERFVGDATSVEIETLQTHYVYTEDDDLEEEPRRSVARCTLAPDGGIRCNGECPDLAIAKPLPPLDCAALARVDWSKLPRGVALDVEEDWGGRFDEDQICIARAWLGIEIDGCFRAPHEVRRIALEPSGAVLTILEPDSGRWLLLHQQVPLVASTREIRVGRARGGLFVSSWTADEHRIQRLNMATHELEPVLPGPCGP